MHVVMVGDFPRYPGQIGGGVEAVVAYLVEALSAYPDISVDVVTMDRWGGDSRSLRHGNAVAHYVPTSRRFSRFSNIENVKRMRSLILDLKPDLVHAHIASQYANAAASTGLPWLLTAHGIIHLEWALRTGFRNRIRHWIRSREEFRIIASADHLISISPFIRRALGRHIKGKVYEIENPIAQPFFSIGGRSVPGQVLYAGRLIPRKDLMTLLQAFAVVKQRLPHARLRLAGGDMFPGEPNTYPSMLREFVRQEGLGDSVMFLGQLDEEAVRREYSECSVFALSSKLETAPMVVMQAMAAGKPVVSTDAGGVRDLVEDGRTGFVVPIGDTGALAKALYRVLSDDQLALSMGTAAKVLAVGRFSAHEVASRTRAVYYGISGGAAPASPTT